MRAEEKRNDSSQKKIVFINLIIIYLFFALGFTLHTSSDPTILGKYTSGYFQILTVVYLSIFPILILLFLFYKHFSIKYKKKKYIITRKHKLIVLSVLLLVFYVFGEFALRNKFKNQEGIYGKKVESYDPFLQNRLSKEDNLNINSLGLRGGETDLKKSPGTYRILVLGGSTVLSPYVEYEKSHGRRLEKLLSDAYPDLKIEVLNAGNDWYTTKHSLIQYMFNLKYTEPDLVIMWHGVNDLVRSCTPDFYSSGIYRADYSHFYGSVAGIVEDKFVKNPFIKIDSYLYSFLNHNLKANLFSDFRKNREILSKATEYKGSPRNEFASLNPYKSNLEETINIVHKNSDIILGNQAFLFKVNMSDEEKRSLWLIKSFCSSNGSYPDIKSSIAALNRFNAAAKNTASEKGIYFVDLESKLNKSLEYFIDDVHTTEKGDEKISQVLFEEIQKNGFIPKN